MGSERPGGSGAVEQRDELASFIKKTRSQGTIAVRVCSAKRLRSAKDLPFSFSRPLDHLVGPQSLWQATKHEHDASPVGNAQANAPDVFSVEAEDFPAAKHMCESSVDRESKCPISSRQHYRKGLERKVVRKQRKVPQTLRRR